MRRFPFSDMSVVVYLATAMRVGSRGTTTVVPPAVVALVIVARSI